MTCKHQHGDMVSGYWLCGQCFQKLPDRPVRYVMEPAVPAGDPGRRRQMPVYAQIRTTESGMTLSQFVSAVARRLVAQTLGGLTMDDAIDYAVDLLKLDEVEFGSDDRDWSVAAACELVSEDMQYWDTAEQLSNGIAAD